MGMAIVDRRVNAAPTFGGTAHGDVGTISELPFAIKDRVLPVETN
jgi:hypothetical protein